MTTLDDLLQPLLLTDDGDADTDTISLRKQLFWLQDELFDEYEPNNYESFDDCLLYWLSNVGDRDSRKRMFRLLKHLFFIGKKQFDALARSAFRDLTTRWLIDQLELDITDMNIATQIQEAVADTWFCPITDSLRINSFLKVNGLNGHGYRPDWRSLEQFACRSLVRSYVKKEAIKFLVLLEDFVGTGQQMFSTVKWASRTLSKTPILVLPLICCPAGAHNGARLRKKFSNVSFTPCLALGAEQLIHRERQSGEHPEFTKIRSIIHKNESKLGVRHSELYGYGETGALVALYSNCPNNTLPLIHSHTEEWNPLFNRISRV